MALIIGLIITLILGYIAALPAIIFKKVKKTNLNWAQKTCFLLLAFFIYNILCRLLAPEAYNIVHAPITGYIMFWFILSDSEKKEEPKEKPKEEL